MSHVTDGRNRRSVRHRPDGGTSNRPLPRSVEVRRLVAVTPLEALDRVIHCLDRAHVGGFKSKAFVRARDVVRNTPADEIADRAAKGPLTALDGIGDSTAKVITEALAGGIPSYLTKLEGETELELSDAARPYREALRGDCHLHSTWSDGGATIEA